MSELGPPPEALLIEQLRTEIRPKLSIRAAAEAAGISDARWRQIAKGHNQASKDVRVPARAPADTLARMARVVGATPDQLRQVGRDDAAAELEALKAAPQERHRNPTENSSLQSSSIEMEIRDSLKALEDKDIRILAMRSHGLSRDSVNALADLAEQFRRLEGLPSGTDDDAL
ncbi:MAG: hypothetical protein K2Q25_02265 [Mycobacteriaceae bacterium]|nr:hypothetical protein [Mycobacteriaceae bacterium]